MPNNTIKLPKGKLTTAITAFLFMTIFSKQILALGTQRTIAHGTGTAKTNLTIQPAVAQSTDSDTHSDTQKITTPTTSKVTTVHHTVQKSDGDRDTETSE